MKHVFTALALGLAAIGGTVAIAQYPRERQPTFEDFLARMMQNQNNRPLECNVQRRLNREGDIIWLRLECRDDRRYGR